MRTSGESANEVGEPYAALPSIGSIQTGAEEEILWGVPGKAVHLKLRPGVSRPNLYSFLILRTAVELGGESVIDMGCGSGALGIAIAASTEMVRKVLCLDIDPSAVALARENVEANDMSNRVEVVESDWLRKAGDAGRCDLIMMSPPHTPCSSEMYALFEHGNASLARSSFGGDDGLMHIRRALVEARAACPEAVVVMAVGSYVVPGLVGESSRLGYKCWVSRRVIVGMSSMAERVRPHIEEELGYRFPEVFGQLAAEISVLYLSPVAAAA